MPYDAVKMKDWQISEAAEKNMPTPDGWRERLGLQKDEMIPQGRLARVDFLKVMKRLEKKKDGKYIEVHHPHASRRRQEYDLLRVDGRYG